MIEKMELIRKHAQGFLDQADIKDTFLPHYQATYAAGALDTKTKRLMALCVGLTHGCTGCILGQTDKAVHEGATTAEVLETCAVALSMGGTLAWSQIYKVMEYLEENNMPG